MTSKEYLKNKAKKKILGIIFMFLKPFIIPILMVLLLVWMGCYITDIFYIGTKNKDDESNFKTELKYYTSKEYSEDEKESFFKSIDEFLSGMFNKKIIDSDWPVPGHTYISSPFGYRTAPTTGASTMHSGIDIPAPEGTEIIAIMDGTVKSTKWGGAGGFTITIESLDGIYQFSYCHSDPNFIVEVGQKVEKGEVIGKVGPKYVYGVEGNKYVDSTGKPTNGATTGCHCHFTLRKNGELVDPQEYLKDALEKEKEAGRWL